MGYGEKAVPMRGYGLKDSKVLNWITVVEVISFCKNFGWKVIKIGSK